MKFCVIQKIIIIIPELNEQSSGLNVVFNVPIPVEQILDPTTTLDDNAVRIKYVNLTLIKLTKIQPDL